MSDFLEHFHASLADYVWEHPDDPASFKAAHPGWEPRLDRLGIYGEFIQTYHRGCLRELFPRAFSLLSEDQERAIVQAHYRTRPATGFEINHLGHAFPEFLREQPDLPSYLAELATFDLCIHEVYTATEPLPDRVESLSVNPSLQTLEFTHELCPWATRYRTRRDALDRGDEEAAGPPLDPPPEGAELALFWRNPQTLFANYMQATPRALLSLKVVLEGLSVEEAAAAGGVGPEDVQQVLDEQVGFGLLLAPTASA